MYLNSGKKNAMFFFRWHEIADSLSANTRYIALYNMMKISYVWLETCDPVELVKHAYFWVWCVVDKVISILYVMLNLKSNLLTLILVVSRPLTYMKSDCKLYGNKDK